MATQYSHIELVQKGFAAVTLCSRFDRNFKKIYEHLSAEDLATDPDWLFAPVLVATKEEQLNITLQKCSLSESKRKATILGLGIVATGST
jgi:hypothetical protein